MDLQAYLPQFKAVVLAHLVEMRDDWWQTLRARARAFEGNIGAVDQNYVIEPNETRESVLASATTLDSGLSVEGTLNASRKFKANAIKIGEIEAQPVYCIDGAGVYLWGITPDSTMTLSFWATFPAYPSGW